MNADVAELRPRLMSVAYRMLGSVADAEDAVQDAFLRLQTTPEVTSPEGFLVTTTTRRCIDLLRANRRRRNYIGPWVPEPVDTPAEAANTVLAESLTQAFLLMLERLSPSERAAFLLRTVFDYEYATIAEILGKSEVYIRQLVSRARTRLEQDRKRFHPERLAAEAFAERFMAACQAGDVTLVEQLVTEDVELHSDGGGKVTAARVVVRGRNLVARFLAKVFGKKLQNYQIQKATVNGEPGVVVACDGTIRYVVSFRIEDGVRTIYFTANPDKLARWSSARID